MPATDGFRSNGRLSGKPRLPADGPVYPLTDSKGKVYQDGAPLRHVAGKPLGGPLQNVARVGWIDKSVPFIGVNNELRRYPEIAQRMPVFERLWCGTFAIPISNDDQRRRVVLLDKVDRRTPRVDSRIIVDRRAEVRNHPLVDGVFAVVAEPVRDSGAGDCGLEAICLCGREHGHKSAIAPAGESNPAGIDGVFGQDSIDARENVAQVAVAEVFAVGLGEGLALTVAATGIGLEDEVAKRGEDRGAQLKAADQRGRIAEAGPPWTSTMSGYFFAGL